MVSLKHIWRRARKPLAVVLVIGSYFLVLQLLGNVHTVVVDELYRAAQISGGDVAKFQQRFGIKTIINLRGENVGKPWYDAELAASNAAGVQHLNFRMSAKRELTEAQAKELIAMMAAAPKPLLIHCNAGADRTGLASAMYLEAVKHQPKNEAEQQLWPIYGHLSLPFIKEYAMDRTFDKLQPMLSQPSP